MQQEPLAPASLRPDLTVIVPVYKNAATLIPLYRRMTLALESARLAFEIVFVDDACPQGSDQIIRGLADRDARVRGILLARNTGQNRAVMAGLAQARGDFTVILDADLQDAPEDIPRLVAALRGGCGAVFAERQGAFQAAHRRLSSKVFKSLVKQLTGVPASASMFMALSRQARAALIGLPTNRPYVVGMVGLTGLPMLSISVTRTARPVGQSAYSSWKRLRTGLGALFTLIALRVGRASKRNETYIPELPVAAYVGIGFTSGGEQNASGQSIPRIS
jgi:glycosyltransferase involved in cell wall biosynthesis